MMTLPSVVTIWLWPCMPNVPEMDVMWTVTENLLVDVNMSGKDVRSSAQAAQKQAESLIKQMQ